MMNAYKKSIAALSAAAAFAGTALVPTAAQAGILHRHPHLAAAAAGIAAHHYAKKGAQSRAAQGRKPNFAERHPILSGIGAAVATHHVLKHH